MYKIPSKQMPFEDFNQPVGMHMNPANRWVEKAELISWDEIEIEYAKVFKGFKGHIAKPAEGFLFKGFNGQVAKLARLALETLLIQIEYGFSDGRTVEEIRENLDLQFFCGLPAYDAFHAPFDPSAMTRFRKRLTPERLKLMRNSSVMIKKRKTAMKPKTRMTNDDKNPPTSKGTLIVDATYAPLPIKYPRDHELLSEEREKVDRIIDAMHNLQDGRRPRTYRDKARKDYLSLARSKRNGAKKIHKAVGK